MILILLAGTVTLCLSTLSILALNHKKKYSPRKIKINPITVLIPAHNEERTIDASISSVLSQQGVLIKELVIVVDNSTDKTAQICQNFAKKNSKIKLLFRNDNLPSKPKSMSLGLEKIKSNQVAMLDADTILQRNAIAKTIYFMKNNNASFGTCLVDPVPVPSLKYEIISTDKLFRQRILQMGKSELKCANLPGCFYVGDTNWLKENVSNSFVEDLVLSYRIIGERNKITVVPEILAFEQERLEFNSFVLQRIRWTIGNISSIPSFLKAFSNNSFSATFGLISFPLFWYFIHYFTFYLIILSFFSREAQISLLILLASYIPALAVTRMMFSKIKMREILISFLYPILAAFFYTIALLGAVWKILVNGFFFYDYSLFKRISFKGVSKK